MKQEDELPIRRKKRYTHVLINLMVNTDGQWKRIRAADWNEGGFNFFLDQEIKGKNALFKKGPQQFSGELVWGQKSIDDALLMEMVLNTLIFNRLKLLTHDKAMAGRIIKLTRAQGRIDEKKKLLKVVDSSVTTEAELEALLQKMKSEHQLYRYGVRTESSEWNKIVQNTLETTEVVLMLSRVGEKLTGLSMNRKEDE